MSTDLFSEEEGRKKAVPVKNKNGAVIKKARIAVPARKPVQNEKTTNANIILKSDAQERKKEQTPNSNIVLKSAAMERVEKQSQKPHKNMKINLAKENHQKNYQSIKTPADSLKENQDGFEKHLIENETDETYASSQFQNFKKQQEDGKYSSDYPEDAGNSANQRKRPEQQRPKTAQKRPVRQQPEKTFKNEQPKQTNYKMMIAGIALICCVIVAATVVILNRNNNSNQENVGQQVEHTEEISDNNTEQEEKKEDEINPKDEMPSSASQVKYDNISMSGGVITGRIPTFLQITEQTDSKIVATNKEKNVIVTYLSDVKRDTPAADKGAGEHSSRVNEIKSRGGNIRFESYKGLESGIQWVEGNKGYYCCRRNAASGSEYEEMLIEYPADKEGFFGELWSSMRESYVTENAINNR